MRNIHNLGIVDQYGNDAEQNSNELSVNKMPITAQDLA